MTAAGDTQREEAMPASEATHLEWIRQLRSHSIISEDECDNFQLNYVGAAIDDAMARGAAVRLPGGTPLSRAARAAAYSDCLAFLYQHRHSFGPSRYPHMEDADARMDGYATLGGDFYRLRNGLQHLVSDRRWVTSISLAMRDFALSMGPWRLERDGNGLDIVDEEPELAAFTEADRRAFLASYLEAALAGVWEADDDDDDDQIVPCRATVTDLCATSLDHITEDCRLFMDACLRELLRAEAVEDEYPDLRREGTYAQAGYDFWMTRTGSGVGFWEDGDWPPEVAGILDAAAKHFGEADVAVDAGVAYFGGTSIRPEELAAAVAAARVSEASRPDPAAPIERPAPLVAEAVVEATTEAPSESPERTGPIRLEEMEAAVAAGIDFLDNNHPGWVSRIVLARLDLRSRSSDICGQLEFTVDQRENIRLGFYHREIREVPAITNYDVLTLLWKVEIQARLLAAPRVVPSVAPTVASVFAGPRRRGRTAAV